MKLNKMKLIISVIMIIAFLSIGLSMNVFAADYNLTLNLNNNDNEVDGDMIEVIESNTNPITINSNVSSTNNTNNTNTPGELANTGLEELPWLIIGVCAVSAIFAYKKIKEYRAY